MKEVKVQRSESAAEYLETSWWSPYLTLLWNLMLCQLLASWHIISIHELWTLSLSLHDFLLLLQNLRVRHDMLCMTHDTYDMLRHIWHVMTHVMCY